MERVERVGLVAQVEAELERMLALGLLPPDGHMPSEHGLARCFGVSRGTVREALRGLSAKGLVVQHPGRRTRVVAWGKAVTLENLSVTLPGDGHLLPGHWELLEGFFALKRELTVQLLVACGERASPADLKRLSEACYALGDDARWDMGEGRWVQQEFALLRQASFAVDQMGHMLLIQSLERAFRGMAKWVLPHLDTQAVQAWAWCAMHALAEKNVQALRQELPPLLQAGDAHLLHSLAPTRQPTVKSHSHPTVAEPHPGEPSASDERGGLPEPVIPNLSNSRAGLGEVPPTEASPSESLAVTACPEPEPAAPWEDNPPIVKEELGRRTASTACPASGDTPGAGPSSRLTTAPTTTSQRISWGPWPPSTSSVPRALSLARADKWGIEDVAEAVLGVHDVHNQLRITRTDAQDPTVLAGDPRKLHS